LKVFTADISADITGFSVSIPDEIDTDLFGQAEKTLEAFESVKALGKYIPGMDKMEIDIKEAMAQKRYSRLRHEVTSYISCKAMNLCNETV